MTCFGTGSDYISIIGKVTCSVCNGTGKCKVCGGTREITVEANVINQNAVPAGKKFDQCLTCKSSGLCPYCNGGKVFYGNPCSHCSGKGVCSSCGGDGGKLVNKPASSSGSSSGSGSSSSFSFITKKKETRECKACYAGSCATCFGSGKEFDPIFLNYVTCSECGGDKNCTVCGGTGEITVEVNVIDQDGVPAGKTFDQCLTCRGSGICPYCNGGKVFFGKHCSHCGGKGACSSCRGEGGKLVDKSASGSGGSSSGGDSSTFVPNPVCNICGGTGTCEMCFGRKKIKQYKDTITCPSCGGTGKCKYCGGEPWKPIF